LSEGFGPGFQPAGSKLYRAEYAAITIWIGAYLVWRTFYAGGLNWFEAVFWVAFPDLAAFIPIGASSQWRTWPPWGAGVYNFFHTLLVWIAAFVLLLAATKSPYWPILGWLGHITADRAVGYGLRARVAPKGSVADKD